MMEKKNLFTLLFAVLFAAPLAIVAIVAQTTTAMTRAFRASSAWDKHPLSLSLQIGRSRPFCPPPRPLASILFLNLKTKEV
ncbi:MAG: hypothetical protein IKT22_08480 [Prevotella sp.]|nr:hypothetical protein [Prevotella sp.]